MVPIQVASAVLLHFVYFRLNLHVYMNWSLCPIPLYSCMYDQQKREKMVAEKIYILQSLLEVSNKLNVYGKLLI